MRIVFSELARTELDEAIKYLEAEFEGLGAAFKADVARAKNLIARHPLAGSVQRDEVRRCLLHKFPYKLLYSIEADHVFVIA